jgi:hypothetical protein
VARTSTATSHPPPRAATPALLLLLPLLVAACATDAPAPPDPGAPGEPTARAPALADEFRLHAEPVTGVRFPVLASGVSVEARHFDASLPASKFRHSIRLATTRTVVLIDVWDNPRQLDVHAWFDAHLAFLVDESTRVSDRPMTRARVPGILLGQPASPQAPSQAVAVFAAGPQVFRVTAIDPEGDATAQRLFDQVVEQLETGVTP